MTMTKCTCSYGNRLKVVSINTNKDGYGSYNNLYYCENVLLVSKFWVHCNWRVLSLNIQWIWGHLYLYRGGKNTNIGALINKLYEVVAPFEWRSIFWEHRHPRLRRIHLLSDWNPFLVTEKGRKGKTEIEIDTKISIKTVLKIGSVLAVECEKIKEEKWRSEEKELDKERRSDRIRHMKVREMVQL